MNLHALSQRWLSPTLFAVALIGLVLAALLTFTGCAGSSNNEVATTLPLDEDFSGDCTWPQGDAGSFTYGCRDGVYQLTLKKLGPYNITQDFALDAPSVAMQVDAQVRTGRGTVPRTEPPSALLGIGCLSDEEHGYLGTVGSNGTEGIARLSPSGLDWRASSIEPWTVPGITRGARLGVVSVKIECVWDGEATLVGLFVKGRLVNAIKDVHGYGPFNVAALYANTYPGVVAFDGFSAIRPGEDEIKAVRLQARLQAEADAP